MTTTYPAGRAEPRRVATSRRGDDGLLVRCQQRIRTVLPTPPGGLEDVQQAISQFRGRPVTVEFTHPGGLNLPAAMWLELDDHDLVWVDRRTSPMMRVVSACHEFGHIISGHRPNDRPGSGPGDEVPSSHEHPVHELAHGRLGLPPGAIQAIMMRCGEEHGPGTRQWHEEREAELIGRMLAARVLRRPRGLAQALTDL